MSIRPSQPQAIGGVLDISFQLYKASIGSVWPLSLLLVLASSPPTLYMIMKGGAIGDPSNPLGALAAMRNPGYWLAYVLSLVLTMWALGALYIKMHAVGTGEELSLGDALRASLGKAPRLVLMSILFGFAIMFGLILLVVPGFILMVSLLLAWNLVLFEDKNAIAALTGSHHLVWGNWWRTAAILTVGFIVVIVAYFAVGLVVGLVLPFAGIGVQDAFLFSLVTGFVVGAVINLLFAPYYISLLLSIYWDLKLRKEGGDLAARVGALGTT